MGFLHQPILRRRALMASWKGWIGHIPTRQTCLTAPISYSSSTPEMKRRVLDSGFLIALLFVFLSRPGAAEIRTIYSLGVSLDGVPGPLVRAEDGSFFAVLSSGGRSGLGSIAHISANASARTM